MSIMSSHQLNWTIGVGGGQFSKGRFSKIIYSGDLSPSFPCRGLIFPNRQCFATSYGSGTRKNWPVFSSAVDDAGSNSDDSEDEVPEKNPFRGEAGGLDSVRENLEKFVGSDDSTFSGIDLATLIRNKYGRSYDVQLIKKEFMGRNLLALNIMWKYREQRSFPLSEEEYILRLDDVANTLRCWGAVAHIRNSLANSKERPRIGKAVSIFIDMDETGCRANEWIYK